MRRNRRHSHLTRRRKEGLQTSDFAESNRERMMAFWKAPGVFTLLMTIALWLAWAGGSALVSLLESGALLLDLPLGSRSTITIGDIGYLLFEFGLSALIIAVPVFVACLVLLFPLRLADEDSMLSKPGIWITWVVGWFALSGLLVFTIYQSQDAQFVIATAIPRQFEDWILASAFIGTHALVGWVGGNWLVQSSGLTRTDKPYEAF